MKQPLLVRQVQVVLLERLRPQLMQQQRHPWPSVQWHLSIKMNQGVMEYLKAASVYSSSWRLAAMVQSVGR
jgi:hypothetical protein